MSSHEVAEMQSAFAPNSTKILGGPLLNVTLYLSIVKEIKCKKSTFKCLKTTRALLYNLLSSEHCPKCFPTMFKPRDIHKFTRGNVAFHAVACRYFRDREVSNLNVNKTLKHYSSVIIIYSSAVTVV